jgi:type I restriction enzyme M protein
VADLKKGTSITERKTVSGVVPVIAGGQSPAYFHNKANREGNIIAVSASGAYAGYLSYWDAPIFASDCITIKSNDENLISTKLIYLLLKDKQDQFYALQSGQAQPHIYAKDIEAIQIPIPSITSQATIFKKLKAEEVKMNAAEKELSKLKNKKLLVLRKLIG